MDLHHPLLTEFPESREMITKLNAVSSHFRQLSAEYHQIDDEICRIEEDVERASDQDLESLKMRRVQLKDRIYHELWVASHKPAAPAMA